MSRIEWSEIEEDDGTYDLSGKVGEIWVSVVYSEVNHLWRGIFDGKEVVHYRVNRETVKIALEKYVDDFIRRLGLS